MNNKGFTMVELLVAMAILALLTVMAFPTLRSISISNNNKKFESYEKTVISAAKLYTDNYSNDLFEDLEINNAEVTLDDLNKKNLIKDIGISGTTCLDNSFVVVAKNHDSYIYCLDIECKSTDGNEIVYSKELNESSNECKKFKTYRINYYSGYDNKYSKDKVLIGNDYTLKSNMFKRNHYDFNKWKDESENREYNVGDKITNVNRDYKIKATWTGKLYTLTYNNNGGTGCTSKSVRYSENARWEDLCAPTKNGKTFEGWNTKSDGTGTKIDRNSKINGSLTVYAVWSIRNQNGPTVNLYKWNGNTDPNGSTTNLSAYTNNTWFSGRVLTKPTAYSGATYYKYKLGTTTENANYKSVTSEKSNAISWYACDSYGCTKETQKTIKLDRTSPACGNVTGASTTWTKNNRTVTVTCSEDTSTGNKAGCEKASFAQTFTTSTKTSTIAIKDKAGNTRNCSVNVYLDKNAPKCTVSYSGGTLGNKGWYKGGTVSSSGTCTDTGGSGCKTSQVQIQTVSSNTPNAGKSVSKVISDNAGNQTTCTSIIKYDNAAPSCGTASVIQGHSHGSCGATYRQVVVDNNSGLSRTNSQARHCYIREPQGYYPDPSWGAENICTSGSLTRSWKAVFKTGTYSSPNGTTGTAYVSHGLNSTNAKVAFQFKVCDVAGNCRDCGKVTKSYLFYNEPCPGS